jgi:hypothetical protein
MATVTPNFNWPVPTSTDLVKDGATAIEALGDSIDGSLVDLKGGTTGQVLAKASGTDMDFAWVAQDDSNAIQNSIVDAKGDLIAASANDTPARLAVGANGETLVADSSTSTGLRYTSNFAAGKNKIINGDFEINQRSFSSTTTDNAFGFDRWLMQASSGCTYSAQTFTAGTAPVAGYEGTNFARLLTTGQSATTTYSLLIQRIENVRTFAGQTVTVSFWAKANSGTPKIAVELQQNFGSGGSSNVNTYAGQTTLSTSWARYSVTIANPSISGKTIGASNFLALQLWTSAGSDYNSRTGSLGIQSNTFDIWGVQVEAGSVATAFQTATGTIQGELAACQRYYWRSSTTNLYGSFATGLGQSATVGDFMVPLSVPMRVVPTSVDFSTLQVNTGANAYAVSALVINTNMATTTTGAVTTTNATGLNAGQFYLLRGANSASAYVGFSAEL